MDRPPRPRLTLRIGIAGHRANKLSPEVQAPIQDRLKAVFKAIDTACHDEHERDKKKGRESLFSPKEPPCVRLVSSLASGADILAAEAIPEGWRLDALIPFDPATYADHDFLPEHNDGQEEWRTRYEKMLARAESTDSVTTLPEPPGGLTESVARYRPAAEFMLREIDILVAVWDGQPGRGDGGTQWTIKRAADRLIPVIWIDEKGQRAWKLDRIEEDGKPVSSEVDATLRDGQIAKIVEAQLDLPAASAEDADSATPKARLTAFFEEPARRWSFWMAYANLLNLALFRRPVLFVKNEDAGIDDNWDLFQSKMSKAEPARRIGDILKDRFICADRAATHFSHVYRSAYVMAYVLSVFLVATALTGIFSGTSNTAAPASQQGCALWRIVLELLLLFAIGLLIFIGKKRRWHQRWLEYRALAEMLRHLRFLAHIGEYGTIRRLANAASPPATAWVHWYVRATIREIGMPGATLSKEYQRNLIEAVKAAEVGPQLQYHDRNSEKLRRLHHWLHRIRETCFWLTVSVLALEVGARWLESHFPVFKIICTMEATRWIGFFAVFFPTSGLAFTGLRFTGDFDGFAQRSSETRALLLDLTADLDRAERRVDLTTTARVLGNIAVAMAEDIAGWRSLYGRKYLEIPG